MNVQAAGLEGSRLSPRNRHVGGVLNQAGLATLLIDLLNADEQAVARGPKRNTQAQRSQMFRPERSG